MCWYFCTVPASKAPKVPALFILLQICCASRHFERCPNRAVSCRKHYDNNNIVTWHRRQCQVTWFCRNRAHSDKHPANLTGQAVRISSTLQQQQQQLRLRTEELWEMNSRIFELFEKDEKAESVNEASFTKRCWSKHKMSTISIS